MQWKALVSLLLSCSEAVSIILFLILTSIIIVIDGYNFIWGFLLLYNVAEIYLCLWQIHRLIFFCRVLCYSLQPKGQVSNLLTFLSLSFAPR